MQILVSTATHAYPVFIEEKVLQGTLELESYIHGTQVLIITNTTVAPLYLNLLEKKLTSHQVKTVVLPDGEKYKNSESLAHIYETLLHSHFHRDATLIALGGGVICDICGFAAATYLRGVNLIHLPTTLLSQVDAAIGGKTAINHPLGKNMIGAFYQPKAVYIDTSTLETLPPREFSAGMGEVLKYAFIAGRDTFDFVQSYMDGNNNQRRLNLKELIYRCCDIKARIVMNDEREQGERAILNFGHTLAHALETATHYKTWLHGEAVGIGMLFALYLSHRLNHCDFQYVAVLKNWLEQYNLPYQIPKNITTQSLMTAMKKDKKNIKDTIRFVLFRSPGRCFLSNGLNFEDVTIALEAFRQGE